MLRLSKDLYNQPVISLRLGGKIGMAEQPIINPHNLKILGWWCKARGDNEPKVLLVEDVREFLKDGFAINDEAALSDSDDLVRHKDILQVKFELIGKLVRTKRHRLGKVTDYSYNDGLFVQKLYVSQPLVKVFANTDTRLIDRTQILEITDHYILVRDTEITAADEELAGAPAAA